MKDVLFTLSGEASGLKEMCENEGYTADDEDEQHECHGGG